MAKMQLCSASVAEEIRNKGRQLLPRQAFRAGLLKLLQSQKSCECLLCGGFNEVLGDGPGGMLLIANELGLAGLVGAKLGTEHFPTHAASKKSQRVGCALASPPLLQAAAKRGYEAFGMALKGGHRGLFAGFGSRALLGSSAAELAKPSKRGINSKDRRNKIIYIKAKYKYLTDHHFFQRLQTLKLQWGPGEAEKLGRGWARSSLKAKKK